MIVPSSSNSITACVRLMASIWPRRSINSRMSTVVTLGSTLGLRRAATGLVFRGGACSVADLLGMITSLRPGSFSLDNRRTLDVERQQQLFFELVHARDEITSGTRH